MKESTRYIRTVCKSVVTMFRNTPTIANYFKATEMLGKLEEYTSYTKTRTGKRMIDDALAEIDTIMSERRHVK